MKMLRRRSEPGPDQGLDWPADGDRTKQDRFYARWGEPVEYAAEQRLEWGRSGPALAPSPEQIAGGGPPPTGIWRVADVAGHNRAFTIVESLPAWRWLGRRGGELLSVIDEAERAAIAGEQPTLDPEEAPSLWRFETYPSGHPRGARDDLDHAAAHFSWLLRDRLVRAAEAVDPSAVQVVEVSGALPFADLLGRWRDQERAALIRGAAILIDSEAL